MPQSPNESYRRPHAKPQVPEPILLLEQNRMTLEANKTLRASLYSHECASEAPLRLHKCPLPLCRLGALPSIFGSPRLGRAPQNVYGTTEILRILFRNRWRVTAGRRAPD